jgi:hypothetical protein
VPNPCPTGGKLTGIHGHQRVKRSRLARSAISQLARQARYRLWLCGGPRRHSSPNVDSKSPRSGRIQAVDRRPTLPNDHHRYHCSTTSAHTRSRSSLLPCRPHHSVSKWEAGGIDLRPRVTNQQALDTYLAKSSTDEHSRFRGAMKAIRYAIAARQLPTSETANGPGARYRSTPPARLRQPGRRDHDRR